jgi:hypothetical protein
VFTSARSSNIAAVTSRGITVPPRPDAGIAIGRADISFACLRVGYEIDALCPFGRTKPYELLTRREISYFEIIEKGASPGMRLIDGFSLDAYLYSKAEEAMRLEARNKVSVV